MSHVLIVDDEPAICWGLARLCRQLGCTSTIAATAEEALECSRRESFDVVFLDVRLPGKSGLEILETIRQQSAFPRIIVMTAYGQLSTAVDAVRKGAFEYLVKPFSLSHVERLLERIIPATNAAATGSEQAADSTPSLNSAQKLEENRFELKPHEAKANQLVGSSPVMQEVFRQIALVSASEACVHIHGESGTGKELAARAIHYYSGREKGPFVPVNLAALNPALAESELFGHVKGAYTGADLSRRGVFDQAAGGTVFLDEVADIPPALQVKLLRALEEREIWPVGADQPHRVDFRLISATNQNLLDAVRSGQFRHDLYYRLVTFQLELPPLRDRVADIPDLARHFLRQVAPKRSHLEFTTEFLSALQERPWHGNVRELRNAIEHALIMSPVASPAPWHLPAAMAPLEVPPGVTSQVNSAASPIHQAIPTAETKGEQDPLTVAVRQWAKTRLQEAKLQANLAIEAAPQQEDAGLHARFLAQAEAELFQTILHQCRQNMSEAARLLGIHRTTLKRKLEEFGLMADD